MSGRSLKRRNNRGIRGSTESKRSSRTESISPELRHLASAIKNLSKQAYREYAPLVNGIVGSKSRDTQQIEQLLDGMLGFCFDEKMLALFKSLCRHYYYIDPAATAAHIYAYREMWDEKSLNKDKKGKLQALSGESGT
jgi:hypothetical protein